MNDRELLELAAKAAGILWDEKGPYTEHMCIQSEFGKGNWLESCRLDWNPLADDGDALRLAVKLGITVGHCGDASAEHGFIVEEDGECQYSSTRRAIVKIAAAIGKIMP